MEVNLYVLGLGVKHGINSKVGGFKIVTPYGGWCCQENAKFFKKRLNPLNFNCGISKRLVLSFVTRAGDNCLFSRAPRDKISLKKNAIATVEQRPSG
jgi:hypothetical protein